MFIINGTSPNRETKCFVFDSPTVARVIGDKLESLGFEVEILDQLGEEIQHFPADPYRRLLGLHM
jgi:hypothetical protein